MLETRRQVVGFYGGLVEDLTAWQPKAPKLSSKEPSGEAEDPRRTAPGAIGAEATPLGIPTGNLSQSLDEPDLGVSDASQVALPPQPPWTPTS